MPYATTPHGWNSLTHAKWLAVRRPTATRPTLAALTTSPVRPLPLVLQLALYFFLADDFRSALTVLENHRQRRAVDRNLPTSPAVCSCSRTGPDISTWPAACPPATFPPCKVWGYVRTSCLVHDRCFGDGPFPLPDIFKSAPGHIGHNESDAQREKQEKQLRPWLVSCPTLRLTNRTRVRASAGRFLRNMVTVPAPFKQ